MGFGRTYAVAFVAGALILLAFFVWHWYTIAPVWSVLFEGLVGVALAALAVAWAWRRSALHGARGGLVFGGVFAGGVLVGELVGLAFGPWEEPGSVAEALPILPWVFVPVAWVALAGWRLAGGWRGALAYFLASLVPLVYLAGSVVQRGGVGLGAQLFALLFVGYLLAGAAMGAVEARGKGRAMAHSGR